MSFHSDTERRSAVASIDLSDALFHAVDLVGASRVSIAAAGKGYGILANKPKAGEDAAVIVDGVTEVRVGAAVAAGDYAVSAASGWIIAAVASIQVASGSFINSKVVLGRFQTGAASGMLAALDVDPYLAPIG
jgi:hypothetical protein